MKTLRMLILTMTIVLFAGCTTTGPGGEQSLVLIGTDTEIQMGAETDVGIRQEYPVSQNANLVGYIQQIGARVAEHSDRQDVQYSFTVLESEVVNAFAAPGGYIYVTTSLLALADDEAEVACVLAHEAGHVVGRHSVRAIQNAMGISLAAELLLGEQGQAWGQLAGLGAGLFQMRNSREHEFQADQFAVKYAVAAGYDPAGAVRFFEKLVALHGSGPGGFAGWLSTHPPTDERIVRANAEIERFDLSGHPQNRNRASYQLYTADLRD